MSLWAKLRGKPLAGGKRAAAMQRIQWAIGIAVTIAVATVWAYGLLDKYERDSIDFRAKYFQSANAHPSDRIAIIAIDDAAIENVGRWPWDRQKLAAVIDELTNAGVSVVALDLLLDDRQAPRPVSTDGGVTYIPDDDILAAAIKRHGRVISAVSFRFLKADEGAAAFQVALSQLYELMAQRPDLVGKPWDGPGGVADGVIGEIPRFKDLPFTRGKGIDKLRLRWEAAGTLASRENDSSFPLPAFARSTPWAVSAEPGVPVKPVADASKRLANVTFNSYDPDGLTRRIPLVVRHHERLWPTLGVAAAIEFLNVQSAEGEGGVAVSADEVRIRSADGKSRSLSAFTQRVENSNVAGLHLVSWPRGISGAGVPVTGWQRQFYDERAGRPAEVPIGRLYEPARIATAVAENLAVLRSLVIEKVYRAQGVMDDERLAQWRAIDADLAAAPVDAPAWNAAIVRAGALLEAANADAQTLIDLSLGGEPLEKLPKDDQDRTANLIAARAASVNAYKAIKDGAAAIGELRHELRARLSGTVCFVGWTATGSLADFVTTSVDPRMPGVHVHAAVCNSLLTGYQRVPGPLAGQLLIVVALGLVGTWIGVRSSVVAGPLLIIGAGLLWGYFASKVLWGMYDSIWSIAGPLFAASAGWLVVVLHRLLVEQRSRRKTEERFKSYVSPAVVDILVQNPSLSSMAPQHKELTVMFTDIAGFTTTAERLGSQGTAELLAVFLGTMTEVVQRHGATLDKYIGDAIMAFWGAPIDDPLHARHACTAAVEMMNTLDRLNGEKAFGAAGVLSIRIGLATGDLMVGDFGNPPRNSSYTVIGDTANLSSRLEGANKVFGTRTLVSDLTRQLAGDGFLWRRIGVIKVKGKQSGIWVHELLPGPVKGEQTTAWLSLCDDLIADFQAERFEAALAKAVKLREEYRDEGFASAYGEAIAARQAGLVEGEFDGSLTLTEK